MAFVIKGKANVQYLLIVVGLSALVTGGILWYSFEVSDLDNFLFIEFPKRKESGVTGSIFIYRFTESKATFQLQAVSLDGQVTEMMVWVENSVEKEWQPIKEFITLSMIDIGDAKVYVMFRDERGNVSPTYSDTINPPIGPPSAPDF